MTDPTGNLKHTHEYVIKVWLSDYWFHFLIIAIIICNGSDHIAPNGCKEKSQIHIQLSNISKLSSSNVYNTDIMQLCIICLVDVIGELCDLISSG